MRSCLAVAALAIATVGTGCALTTGHVEAPTVAASAPVRGQLQVVVGPVVDRRSQPRVGVKKNGYGWVTADVKATNDVVASVRKSLGKSLAASNVMLTEDPQAGPTWRVDAELLQYFAEPKMGFWSCDMTGEVQLHVTVTAPNGAMYQRLFVGHSLKEGILIVDMDDAEEVLAGALHHALWQSIVGIEHVAAIHG